MNRRTLLAAGGAIAVHARAAEAASPLAWYCWRAEPWLAAPDAQLARVPFGTERILLGLDGSQLHAAAAAEGQGRIHELVARAQGRGVAVHLLLGEPEWARAPGRQRLLALLQAVRHLPFAGLNLDIERHQLPPAAHAQWHAGVLQTLRDVRERVDWPLALTTHYLDLLDAGFNTALAQAGVGEIVPMIFVSFPHLALERARRVLAANAAHLRVTVAQSAERQLPRGESWHRHGRQVALKAWAELGAALVREGASGGIAVQSWDEFHAAPA